MKSLITFFGGKGKSLFVGLVDAAILVLVDDSSPVGKVDFCVEQSMKRFYAYAVGLARFDCLNVFFADFALIEFVHAENYASFYRKRCRDFFSVHNPETSRHSFLDEIGHAGGFPFFNLEMTSGKSECNEIVALYIRRRVFYRPCLAYGIYDIWNLKSVHTG